MTREEFHIIVRMLKENSIDFKIDTHINTGKSCFRGFFIYNNAESKVRNLIGDGLMKEFKVKKTYVWYLGEKKKAILLKPREELVLEIPETESLEINNTA